MSDFDNFSGETKGLASVLVVSLSLRRFAASGEDILGYRGSQRNWTRLGRRVGGADDDRELGLHLSPDWDMFSMSHVGVLLLH